jgi:hypothetical protein
LFQELREQEKENKNTKNAGFGFITESVKLGFPQNFNFFRNFES